MVLAIDVGNTNIVLGGYEKERNLFLARMATDHRLEADQYAVQFQSILALYKVSQSEIEGIVMTSVVSAVTQVLTRALGHLCPHPVRLLGHDDAGDVVIDIENPRELGTDILASAIAVRHTRPLPAVIIDMGTATKLTALDAEGRLRGVAITPGLFISLNALVSGASALAGIPLEAPRVAIGRNTADSMKSGVVLGAASMLDGMIDRFEKEMGPVKSVLATGGAASVVVPHCRRTVELSNTLLLDGLMIAYERYMK